MNENKQLFPVTEAQPRPIQLSNPKAVQSCKDGVTALRQTALHSGYSQEVLADKVGKAKKVLSRALTGTSSLLIDTLIRLMRESDSVFLLEYMCKEMGGEFVFISDEEKDYRLAKEKFEQMEAKRRAA